MTPSQRAEARSRAYALLAGLWIEGLTEARLSAVQQTPLAGALPDQIDLDLLAAAHHRATSMELLPYAGVFLDTDDTMGGAAQRFFTDSRTTGFHPDTTNTRADHLGLLLAWLAFLCGAEADALEDGMGETAARVVTLQQDALDRHLLSWLPPLWAAGRRSLRGFWAAVLDMTAAVILDHRGDVAAPPPLPDSAAGLLDAPKTSVWRIAGALSTPATSGVFLTRVDLRVLGRAAGVPRGFGARQQMIANLLRNAAEYQS
ncbi:MAG: molecular chaperone TorD family protein, partial [Myxococcota bacterium]